MAGFSKKAEEKIDLKAMVKIGAASALVAEKR